MADAAEPPILEFDPDPNAVFEPHHVVVPGERVPTRAVLCFFSQVIDRLRDEAAARERRDHRTRPGRAEEVGRT